MLEFTKVSRWFRVADGYSLRYSTGNRSWRVCAPGGKLLGTVGDVAEGERLANQHAEDEAAATAALTAPEDDPPFDGFHTIHNLPVGDRRGVEIEVRGYSVDDIDRAAEEQGIGVGAAMLSLAMGAPYADLVRSPSEPAASEYLTNGHESARMVTEINDDRGAVTMKPCQCLSPTGQTEDGFIVATPCGGEVPNKRAFRPGHDAKLKSTMIKAHRNGGVVVVRDGGNRTEITAKAIAKERGWERFLTDAPARKTKAKADGKDNSGVDHADDQPDAEPVGASAPARVKVRGAWKDGFIVRREPADGDRPEQVVVSYTNSKRKQVEVAHPVGSDKLQIG